MKKIVLLIIILANICIINAQPIQVQSAFNFMRRGQLDKAKEAIDLATVNERTMNDAKTWFYRGNIYLDIHLSEDPKYKRLERNALQVAYDAFQKAVELDQPKEYFEQVKMRLYICGEQFYNLGVELFNKELYEEALISFEKTAKVNAIFGVQDSLATFNAAISAQFSNQMEKAKDNYMKLVRMNYNNPRIYIALSEIYKSENDTVQMVRIIENGRRKFPEDYNLIIAETNVYLAKGDIEKAQQNLQLAITQNPGNKNLHFAIGANYDALNNFDEAEKAYLKAIELDSNYFDPIYNIGALYFNKGVAIFEEADKIPPTANNAQALYDAKKAEFEAMWAKALPYLEKAHQLVPDDLSTLNSLSQLYARTRDFEKLRATNEKIRAINERAGQ
ncbi:MAG: tetratricopeptide repeat protein [Bacteroidales bacterium]|nr:tetratricopeptide repeat protein [Bacteroidales bacterium]